MTVIEKTGTENSLLSLYAHPHWPDLTPIAEASTVVQVHLIAAVVAFAIATLQIVGPKGTIPHRLLGWVWVIFMFTVAVSSFFIQMINPHGFSFIHILSALTLISLPMLVFAARKHDVKAHRRHAINLYAGALLIAGIFTLMPGRLMWHVFFG